MTARRQNTLSILALVIALAAVAIALRSYFTAPASSAIPTASKNPVIERVLEAGKIRVGYVVWPPSVISDPNTGKLSGIFPDTLAEVGKNLGLEIDYVEETGWGTMIEGLETGRFDLVCAQVWPTATRAKKAGFLEPLFYVGVGAYVRADDRRFDGLRSININSVKIGTIDGEMSDIIARTDYPEAKRVSLTQLADASQQLLEIVNRKADLTFMMTADGEKFARANANAVRNLVPENPVRIFPNVMMVKRGEPEFEEMLDVAILEVINSGYVDSLVDKYEPFPGSLYHRTKPFRANVAQ